MRAALLIVACLLLAAPVAAQAAQDLRFKTVAVAASEVHGDGSTVAWQEAPGRVLVRPGRGAAKVVVARPECPGALAAVGGGYVLIRCPEYFDPFMVVPYDVIEIASGRTTTTLADMRYWTQNGPPSLDQIGTDWVGGADPGTPDGSFLLNWRTGAVQRAFDDAYGEGRYLDLSYPRLGRRLCTPLRRRLTEPVSDISAPALRYERVSVDGRYALSGGGGDVSTTLRLGRCGRAGLRAVGSGTQATLGAGWLTWIARIDVAGRSAEVRARRASGERVLRARLPSATVTVSHTRAALYVSVPVAGRALVPAYTILRAALPHMR
jgi:hypothetical protein